MRMIRKVEAVCLILLACGFLSGCKKDGETGRSIRFIARSRSALTKTAYSSHEANGKVRIDWKKGDVFTVYSDNARHIQDANRHTANYIVQSIQVVDDPSLTSGNQLRSQAIVDPVDHNGLQWGNGTGPFTFYARYPAADPSNSDDDINGTKMKAVMPHVQSLVTDIDGLLYAFMFAKTENVANSDEVPLDFDPMFTAFEFEVGPGKNTSVTLQSFTLSSSSQPIAGKFELACSSGTVTALESSRMQITVDLDDTVVDDTHHLTFLVLALPQVLTDLSITFDGTEIGTRTLALNYGSNPPSGIEANSPIQFAACHKHIIYGLSFPQILIAEEGGTDPNKEDILWDLETQGENVIWDQRLNRQ